MDLIVKQSNMADVKYIPKLRFPEFENDGEWKVVKLGDIARRITLKNKDKKSLPVLTNSASGGIVKQEDYFDREIVSKDNLINYYIVSDDDFVYNPRISTIAPVGPISRNKIGEGVMSPLYTVFRFVEGDVDFFEHYFKTNNWHQYLKDKANFGARFDRMNITTEDFISLPIPFPSLPEQQKIAAFLTSLDEQISAHTKKLEALKAHKKGLMQQLFPANGEKTPKLRFPEFKNAGKWKEVRLGEIAERRKEKVGSKLLEPISVSAGIGIVSQKQKFGKDISGNQYKNYIHIQRGDYVYNKGYSKTFPQGSIYELTDFAEAAAPNAFICFRFKNNFCPQFFNGYFEQNSHGKQLVKYITSGARGDGLLNLNPDNFFKIKFLIPSFPEQQKIASFLSSIDEMIQAQDDKIRKLKTYKNGLMQQMFAK